MLAWLVSQALTLSVESSLSLLDKAAAEFLALLFLLLLFVLLLGQLVLLLRLLRLYALLPLLHLLHPMTLACLSLRVHRCRLLTRCRLYQKM